MASIFCLACGCATTDAPLTPGEPLVRRFDMQGVHGVSEKLLRARIVTTETSRLPFSRRYYLDEAAFETDLKRIVRFYRAQGYYQARIIEHQIIAAGPNAVDISLAIDEGPPVTVANLEIHGLDSLPNQDGDQELLLDLPLKIGDIFREEAYESLKRVLLSRLKELGYAQATIFGTAEIDIAQSQAVVVVEVTPGPICHFGNIVVDGASGALGEIIVEEAQTVLSPGQTFSESALSQAQRRIFNLGVFSTVRVTCPVDNQTILPVYIHVGEASYRTLRLSGGVGFDSTRTDLPRITADWTHRNFLGELRKLSFNNEIALVFLPSLLSTINSQPYQVGVALRSDLQLQQPRFIAPNLDLTTSLGFQHDLDQSFNYNAVRASLGVVYRRNSRLYLVPSYNLALFKLSGAVTQAVTDTTQEAVLDECARTKPPQLCLLAYLEQRAVYDLRDNQIEPTKGAYFSLSLQEGSQYLGGRYDYLRLWPEIRGYWPIGPHVIAARVQAGFLWHRQTSSVLTRFYLGGTASQRGFGNRQLSPRAQVCRFVDGQGNCQTAAQAGKSADTYVTEALPVGGNGMVGANFEVRFALGTDLGLVTFIDAGEVMPEINQLNYRAVQYAVGLGLRYRTFFGPLRLDFGYRLNNLFPAATPPGIDIAFLTNPPAGVQLPIVPRYSVHFSIGEAY